MSAAEEVTLPGFEPPVLSTDDALAETAEIMERAIAEHRPSRRFLLFSGGNDSLVVLDALASMADEIVHVSTGPGAMETTLTIRCCRWPSAGQPAHTEPEAQA